MDLFTLHCFYAISSASTEAPRAIDTFSTATLPVCYYLVFSEGSRDTLEEPSGPSVEGKYSWVWIDFTTRPISVLISRPGSTAAAASTASASGSPPRWSPRKPEFASRYFRNAFWRDATGISNRHAFRLRPVRSPDHSLISSPTPSTTSCQIVEEACREWRPRLRLSP